MKNKTLMIVFAIIIAIFLFKAIGMLMTLFGVIMAGLFKILILVGLSAGIYFYIRYKYKKK